MARNNVFDIWDLPRDVQVILTSLASLNERKKKKKKIPPKNMPRHSLKRNSRILLVSRLIAVQAILQQLLSSSIKPTVVWQLQRHGYLRVSQLSLSDYAVLFHTGVLLPSTLPGSVGKLSLCFHQTLFFWQVEDSSSISNLSTELSSPYLNLIFFLF